MNPFLFFSLLYFSSFSTEIPAEDLKVKCMMQMIEYRGEGAYINVSVVDQEGRYLKTIYVMGNDKSWFSEMPSFWKHLRANDLYTDEAFYPLIDGITGATISGGERRVLRLSIPKNLIKTTHALRFETAVEDKIYYQDDIQFSLGEAAFSQRYQGQGYIKSIQFSKEN